MSKGRPSVLVTQPIDSTAMEALRGFAAVTLWPGPYPIPPRDLPRALRDQDALLSILTDLVDGRLLAACPSLRVVANLAVGYDNIDVAAAEQLGIAVTNTPDVLTDATAELTWALILGLVRGIVPARAALLAGEWRHWSPTGFLGQGLGGKTLGVVGLGRIGRAVAARATAFGMHVIALGQRGQGEYPRLERRQFLGRADIVTLHLPLTSETAHLVDSSWLHAMRRGAYLVNTARGGLVDEAALLRALNDGTLAGAALDVFAAEPVDGTHPLASHPRVLATPHIGSATVEARRAMAQRAVANLEAVLRGRRPPDLVNPRAWPGRSADGPATPLRARSKRPDAPKSR